MTGRASQTTNNRMELRAAIEALNTLNRPCRVEIYTDSEYLRRGITEWVKGWQRNGWKTAAKQPVKNRDLWQALVAAVERHAPAGGVVWQWTKGHAGDAYNEARRHAKRSAGFRGGVNQEAVWKFTNVEAKTERRKGSAEQFSANLCISAPLRQTGQFPNSL